MKVGVGMFVTGYTVDAVTFARAAVTSKVRLGTGVTLLPERHPLTLAKTVSTLDSFSGGRVTLGVGAGWLREEIELYRADLDDC